MELLRSFRVSAADGTGMRIPFRNMPEQIIMESAVREKPSASYLSQQLLIKIRIVYYHHRRKILVQFDVTPRCRQILLGTSQKICILAVQIWKGEKGGNLRLDFYLFQSFKSLALLCFPSLKKFRLCCWLNLNDLNQMTLYLLLISLLLKLTEPLQCLFPADVGIITQVKIYGVAKDKSVYSDRLFTLFL